MKLARRVATLTWVLLAPFASAQQERPVIPFTWKGISATSDAPPDGLDPRPLAAIERFGPWARSRGYRLDVERHGRILLITPAAADVPVARLAKIEATLELFDRLLQPPLTSLAKAGAPTPKSKGATITEDPEGAPPVVITPKSTGPAAATDAESPTADTSVDAAFVADQQAPTVILLRDADDYERLLDHLDDLEPYLRPWVDVARTQTGFVLERPLIGGFMVAPPDGEEWDPDNEIVHRALRLLVLGRYSQQPYWLALGLAWVAEFHVQKSVYCFPNRAGFVGIGEHSDWDRDLAQRFRDRAGESLALEEFAGWRRGTYDDDAARIAWGVADHLARARPADLARLHEEFRVLRHLRNRVQTGEGKWERKPGFELALDDQDAVLVQLLGPTYLADLTRHFRGAAK